MSGVIRIRGTFPDLQVHDHGGYQSRHASTLAMLRAVFTAHAAQFNGLSYDFAICTVDNPESANVLAEKLPFVLTYSVTPACRANIIAIPDFVYHGWPEAGIDSYETCTAAIAEAGRQPPAIAKAFWIGNASMDPSREDMVRIGAEHPDDMRFIAMEWQKADAPAGQRLQASQYVSIPDHARYAMLLDIRGAGYSGRLKLLMHANRPILLVERRFREFFYDKLTPNDDFLPVKEDLSNLAAQTAKIKRDGALAEHLARRATQFAAQYLTKNYAMDYLRDVLLRIGSVKSL